ncbi:hypothetical protein [Rickettsiales endosymbiont of Stachyamoeba lipophora]|uniref:hypothetical protein n=1 Tax=Rickettsiales endosymbiont of Stachyamoeba lipophora TaxID=2486578 RepID=UPI000F652DC3|nr:hypothetical protein [Rickettsiales endosymbiont of Stachyamoeba lipophora]AZL15771.1 hypothetical protein EF513_04325 [Rickettsiales endosymbiont of Stachyamoeba lipophora]
MITNQSDRIFSERERSANPSVVLHQPIFDSLAEQAIDYSKFLAARYPDKISESKELQHILSYFGISDLASVSKEDLQTPFYLNDEKNEKLSQLVNILYNTNKLFSYGLNIQVPGFGSFDQEKKVSVTNQIISKLSRGGGDRLVIMFYAVIAQESVKPSYIKNKKISCTQVAEYLKVLNGQFHYFGGVDNSITPEVFEKICRFVYVSKIITKMSRSDQIAAIYPMESCKNFCASLATKSLEQIDEIISKIDKCNNSELQVKFDNRSTVARIVSASNVHGMFH